MLTEDEEEDSIMASTARLEARITPELHALVKQAARVQGRTMTDFIIAAVQESAQKAIEQAEVIRLSLADQECFAQAILSPPSPSLALKRALTHHKALVASSE